MAVPTAGNVRQTWLPSEWPSGSGKWLVLLDTVTLEDHRGPGILTAAWYTGRGGDQCNGGSDCSRKYNWRSYLMPHCKICKSYMLLYSEPSILVAVYRVRVRHSIETPSMIDHQWSILHWRSWCISKQSFEVQLSVSGGQPLFTSGLPGFALSRPRILPVRAAGPQYQHQFFHLFQKYHLKDTNKI